jgi:hypothetical protein
MATIDRDRVQILIDESLDPLDVGRVDLDNLVVRAADARGPTRGAARGSAARGSGNESRRGLGWLRRVR